jgi:hypothetical protein
LLGLEVPGGGMLFVTARQGLLGAKHVKQI